MDLERSPFLQLVRDQMKDTVGRPWDYMLGGDDDAIEFWLALTGNCDTDRHDEMHRALWSIIDSRPYRCLNHGDPDPSNIFRLNPRAHSSGGTSTAAESEDAALAREQAVASRTARAQQLESVATGTTTLADIAAATEADTTDAQMDLQMHSDPQPEPEPEPELGWIDWQFAHAGVPGLDLAALLTRALVRYPDPVRSIPLTFEKKSFENVQEHLLIFARCLCCRL